MCLGRKPTPIIISRFPWPRTPPSPSHYRRHADHGLHHRHCLRHHNNYTHQHEISCARHMQLLSPGSLTGRTRKQQKKRAEPASQRLLMPRPVRGPAGPVVRWPASPASSWGRGRPETGLSTCSLVPWQAQGPRPLPILIPPQSPVYYL